MTNRRPILDTLLQKAHQLPKVPGVYLMKDDKDRVIYVGKASNLPNRVTTYFLPSTDLGPKKQPMLDLVEDFDFIECEGEWEALLTENRLIKDIHPKFNVLLKDGKTFPYLIITIKDDFPGVYITREPNAPQYKGAKIFGPFTSVTALRESVQLLQRVFKFRTCELKIDADDPKLKFFRPCLLYPIKQCTGPCGAKISKKEYRHDIDNFIRFIGSKRSIMIKEMKADMLKASQSLDFEKATILRDQIRAIEKLDQRGKVSQNWQPEAESFYVDPKKGLESLQRALQTNHEIRCMECIDIAHLQGNETVGSKVCFVDGKPLKNEYRRYKIKTAANDDYQSIREVVERRYSQAGQGNELYPDLIIIDGGIGQLHAAQQILDTFDIKPPLLISLAKKEELIYKQGQAEPIKLSRNHLGLKLVQSIRDEAHRFAQHYHHILRKKKTLGQD